MTGHGQGGRGTEVDLRAIVEPGPGVLEVRTAGSGPAGRLPLTPELLVESPSGDIFGMTQNAGMGWDPAELLRPQFLILSTQGGIRAPDGRPVALGYHTGHWEVGLLMQAAAEELRALECLPYAGFAANICILLRDYGTRAMGQRGYNIALLRDCTVGIESHDTLEGMWLTHGAIRSVEILTGYSLTSEEFLRACRQGLS